MKLLRPPLPMNILVGLLLMGLPSCNEDLKQSFSNSRKTKPLPQNAANKFNLVDPNTAYLTAAWPDPKTTGYTKDACVPLIVDIACESDATAVLVATDTISNALSHHATVSIEAAVNKIIGLANHHKASLILQALGQIAECSKVVASPAYKEALPFVTQDLMYLPAGRVSFLKSVGISVPSSSSDSSEMMDSQFKEMTLKQALESFADRSAAPDDSRKNSRGEILLTRGAIACDDALLPFAYKKYAEEIVAYPLIMTIISVSGETEFDAGSTATFRVEVQNTNDTTGFYFSIDSNWGSFSGSGGLEDTITFSNWMSGTTNITVSYGDYMMEGSMSTASLEITVTESPMSSFGASGGME